jgi:4-hydroxy-2-oxoheptanedioate aldolase
MSSDRMRRNLSAGLPTFAAWMSIGDSFCAEVLGRAGYDCVVLDAQHGGITWESMGRLVQALDLNQTPGIVRVPSTDQAGIMRALDLGAAGVIVPMVSNEAQAQTAAEATRYPPQGLRSFGMVRNHYGVQTNSFQPLCLVMIETAEAMSNLDAIAAVPGVDGLFVGPVDLALSLGLGPILDMRDEVLGSIESVVSICRLHKKICGSASLGLPYARALLDRGVQLVAQGSDIGFVRRGAASELETLHAWRDESQTRSAR